MGRKSTSNLYKALKKYKFSKVEIQEILGADYVWEKRVSEAGFVFDDNDSLYYLSDLYIEKVLNNMPFLNKLFESSYQDKDIFSVNDISVFFAICGGLHNYLKNADLENDMIVTFNREYNNQLLNTVDRRYEFASDWNQAAGRLIGLDSQFDSERAHSFEITNRGIETLFSHVSQATGERVPTEGLKKSYKTYIDERELQEGSIRNR